MKRLCIIWIILFHLIPLPAHAERVCKVYDGDTFTLCDDRRIRFWGIDAPELKQPGGYQSRDYLKSLILNKDVSLYCKGKSFKRRVCSVGLGQVDVEEAMVLAGLAFDYTKYSHGRYAAAEKEARDQKRGLWQGNKRGIVKPWEYRQQRRKPRNP